MVVWMGVGGVIQCVAHSGIDLNITSMCVYLLYLWCYFTRRQLVSLHLGLEFLRVPLFLHGYMHVGDKK